MAEGYSTGGLIRRVILLVLVIIILTIGGILWLNTLGVVEIGGNFGAIGKVLGIRSSSRELAVNDPDLLIRERFNKDRESLKTLEFEIDQRQNAVEQEEERLANWDASLKEQDKQLKEREELLKAAEERYNDSKANLLKNASYLMNMPPDQAIQILLGMDDQDVIDNLRAADELAELEATASLVPVWLQMIAALPNAEGQEIANADRAATIMRKMAMRSTDS